MSEIVYRLGLNRLSTRIYYVKGAEVCSVPRKGLPGGPRVEHRGGFNHETGYLYFVNANGNVCRTKISR